MYLTVVIMETMSRANIKWPALWCVGGTRKCRDRLSQQFVVASSGSRYSSQSWWSFWWFYPNCQQWRWWWGWQFAEALSGTRCSSQSWASFWYIDYDEDDHDADTNKNDDGDDKEDNYDYNDHDYDDHDDHDGDADDDVMKGRWLQPANTGAAVDDNWRIWRRVRSCRVPKNDLLSDFPWRFQEGWYFQPFSWVKGPCPIFYTE